MGWKTTGCLPSIKYFCSFRFQEDFQVVVFAIQEKSHSSSSVQSFGQKGTCVWIENLSTNFTN